MGPIRVYFDWFLRTLQAIFIIGFDASTNCPVNNCHLRYPKVILSFDENSNDVRINGSYKMGRIMGFIKMRDN